jgi:probable F420-dependent oxidoreductase
MKIGVVYPQIELGGDPEAVRRIGQATESLGFDHLLSYDHVLGAVHENREPPLMGPYTENDPFHDPLVMSAYLAGRTERIELVTGVLILPQRQTALVARQAADVDLFSDGRLRLGVGTGWNWVEYEALGIDFETRGPRMTEQVEVMRRLWSEPLVSVDGRFHEIDRVSLHPRPRRQIPIWFGGFAPPAFRRAAKHGDGFIYAGPVANAKAGMEQVRGLLDVEQRDSTAFGHEMVAMTARSADEVLSQADDWRAQGGTHFSICTMGLELGPVDAHIEYLQTVADRLDRSQ